jgi:uncharacterized damage-inducible protein DinB
MSRTTLLAAAAALALLHAPACAQQPTLVTDLLRDVGEVESKTLALAEAMPESAYGWRPGEGVRSVSEVFKHVIAENYLIAGVTGPTPPAITGIVPTDYATTQAYEARELSKAEIIADLKASFAFFEGAVRDTSADELGATIAVFGSSATYQQLWIMGVTHLHEHLGQVIAYARVNGVVPPWSR